MLLFKGLSELQPLADRILARAVEFNRTNDSNLTAPVVIIFEPRGGLLTGLAGAITSHNENKPTGLKLKAHAKREAAGMVTVRFIPANAKVRELSGVSGYQVGERAAFPKARLGDLIKLGVCEAVAAPEADATEARA